MISGETKLERKTALGHLVVKYLQSLGYKAELIKNRENSEGHKDQVLVDSDLGLIHLTATESIDPNASIRTANLIDGTQAFLADKQYVAYGWNTRDKRTFVIMVEANKVRGCRMLEKKKIVSMKTKSLSQVIA